MIIKGEHKDPRSDKKKKSPAEKKRKAFTLLKKKFFIRVKKICRERTICIMSGEGFGKCGGVVCASHIKSEGAWKNLYVNPHNIFPMCYHHHIQVWHKDVTATGRWFAERYPDELAYLEKAKYIHIDFMNPVVVETLYIAAQTGYEHYVAVYDALSPV